MVFEQSILPRQVQDAYPYPVAFSWQTSASDNDKVEGEDAPLPSNSEVFKKLNPLPNSKIVNFYRSEPFSLDAVYNDTSLLPPGYPTTLGTFQVCDVRGFGCILCSASPVSSCTVRCAVV